MMIIQWLPRQPFIVATRKMRNNYIGQDDRKNNQLIYQASYIGRHGNCAVY